MLAPIFAPIVVLAIMTGAPKTKDNVDPLALARVMLLDGHASRAVAVLANVVIEEQEEAFDVSELYRLRGLALFETGAYSEAAQALQLAIKHGQDTAAIRYAIASAFYKLNDRRRAFSAADIGFARFPKDASLERLRVLLLLELGLSQEGLTAAKALFRRPEITSKDYLALASALSSARDLQGAAALLESAVLRFPEEREPREQLSRTYFEADRPYSAAQVLYPIALVDPSAALVAAELYRRSGKVEQALRMNGLVADQKKKIRQRLTLLIEAERYHEAAALDDRVERLGLLADEKLLYALAYAQYIAGNTARTEELLGRVSEPELYAKAVAIRRAVETCSEDVWQCD